MFHVTLVMIDIPLAAPERLVPVGCRCSDMLENLVRNLELDGLWDALSSCLTVVSVLEVSWGIFCFHVLLVIGYYCLVDGFGLLPSFGIYPTLGE